MRSRSFVRLRSSLSRRRSSSSVSWRSSTTTASTGSVLGPTVTCVGVSPSLKTSTDAIAT